MLKLEDMKFPETLDAKIFYSMCKKHISAAQLQFQGLGFLPPKISALEDKFHVLGGENGKVATLIGIGHETLLLSRLPGEEEIRSNIFDNNDPAIVISLAQSMAIIVLTALLLDVFELFPWHSVRKSSVGSNVKLRVSTEAARTTS
ncbi:hypothetical protein C8R41DRAFT_901476 [Lentinula lateritia]|uniref:Uncharacterized protein n=1 Tax=Lentinula lateritia TaxID=40482 RepID=A0ABQ8VMI8_9AGAR|nr:hypothetical protein C8R41DRAFT_901476 [Lentinula lateritia]